MELRVHFRGRVINKRLQECFIEFQIPWVFLISLLSSLSNILLLKKSILKQMFLIVVLAEHVFIHLFIHSFIRLKCL